MKEIIVKSQQELDSIDANDDVVIKIEFGNIFNPAVVRKRYKYNVVARENSNVEARGNSNVVAWENSNVEARENSSVVAWENSNVEARGNSNVVARENSNVEARGNSNVVARENSNVVAWENSNVVARGNSNVVAWENSNVVAWENSNVVARENSNVVAWENSNVVARENSNVEARENSSVEAWENSNVVARGNSNVVARENSNVEAGENSNVVAWENSNVVAWENSQVVKRSDYTKIKTAGNARIVQNPRNVEDYMNYYDIKHTKTTALLYKAVHKRKDKYISDYDRSFEYHIGGKTKVEFFDSMPSNECGQGIHVSHLQWAIDYGKNWKDLAIIELRVKIKDILLPDCSNGKVRVPEAEVIREVPLEDCGLYGKILMARR